MEAKDKLFASANSPVATGSPWRDASHESAWRGSALGGAGQPRARRAARAHLARTRPEGVDPFGWDPEYARYAIAARPRCRAPISAPSFRASRTCQRAGCSSWRTTPARFPLDGLIIAISVFLEANPPRLVRAMVEKWSQTLPFVSTFFAKCGQVVGVPENAHRLLARGEALLVFPEGISGISKTFQKRYQLTDSASASCASRSRRTRRSSRSAVVGAEEQYISVGNLRSVAKALQMPAFPIIPQLFIPGGQFPLPTRYRFHFGEPLHFRGDPDDDDAVIEEKVWVVKATIQSMINRGLKERKSLFF